MLGSMQLGLIFRKVQSQSFIRRMTLVIKVYILLLFSVAQQLFFQELVLVPLDP